jgi:DNA modification methylase
MRRIAAGSKTNLAIELWPIERPIPYESNPRLCPPQAIAKVAASIEEFGFLQAIVVDNADVVIVGHTRLLAAKQLGMKVIPVHVAAELSPAQAAAYRVADNRTNQETSWDEDLLSVEISKLAALDYDIDVLGFESGELAKLLVQPTVGLVDPDAVPELPAEPLTRPGDLWILGDHRLLCGDATKASDVAKVMDGERATLMATDPPYLVNYDGGNHPQTWANRGKRADGTNRPEAEYEKRWDAYVDADHSIAFYQTFLAVAIAEALGERPAIYQWFGMMRMSCVDIAWAANNVKLHQVLIWHKSRPVLGRCWFMWDYEPCAVGWLEGKQPTPKRRPPANARAVWPVDQKEGVEEGLGAVHPTIKPVEVIRRPIEWHTLPGELIYEPFSGSGTAIIAAQMTGRRCNAIELSPTFCDVTVKRWEAFTARTAVRDGARD